MGTSVRTISASGLSCFQSCQKKFEFKYTERLEPLRKSIELERGSVIHECVQRWWRRESMTPALEEWHSHKKATLMREEYKEWLKEYDNVVTLVNRYASCYKEPPKDSVVVAQEFELLVPVAEGVRLLGYVDQVVSWGGQLWVVEHKSAGNLTERMKDLEIDPQVTTYLYGLRKQGMSVAACLFDGISTYPYRDREAQDCNKLFRRATLFRTDEHLEEFEKNLLMIARQMDEAEERGVYARHLGYGCRRCDFRDVCFSEVERNQDLADAYRRTDFRIREKGGR